MTTGGQDPFGQLLWQAREAAGLSRRQLARRVGLDASYIYRLETGDRRPSREVVLVLAEVVGVDGEAVNKWLMAAGYAPQPLLSRVRAAVRTRGAVRRPSSDAASSSTGEAGMWAQLEAMGLQEAGLRRLLQAMETATFTDQQDVARMVSGTFIRIAECLEAPVRTAVIPAAGGQHRLLALHVMQRLLLRTIGEAADSGISHIILVLAPGTVEPLYTPLKQALDLAVVPPIEVRYVEQTRPEGLGDAILQAEALVGREPFAVLLPDDVVRERMGRTAYSRELRRMMDAFRELGEGHLVAVTPVPKSKLSNYGVAQLGTEGVRPRILPIAQLIEKPDPSHEICQSPQAVGIVGRYLLQPSIFAPLRGLKDQGRRPLHLTDALERLRQAGEDIYAFELEATREDVGEVLGQASELIGDASESLSAT